MNHFDTVREFVINNYLFGDGSRLQDDTSFLETGIIDSTGILELVSFLEETYDITVADEELVPENLDTLKDIVLYLERKLAQTEPTHGIP